MKRLPEWDSRTSRFEWIVFSALGLVAIGLIFMTTQDAARFARSQEQIVNALSNPLPIVEGTNPTGLIVRGRGLSRPSTTNFRNIRVMISDDMVPLPASGKGRPQS